MPWGLIVGPGWKADGGNDSLSALVEAEFSLPQWQERLVSLGFGSDVALHGRGKHME